MNKKQALEFLHSKMKNKNLRRHCYAVGAVMKALAKHFKMNAELVYTEHTECVEAWEVAGILHDADYEVTKENPTQHVLTVLEWLKDEDIDQAVRDAIFAHAWKFVPECPEPVGNMQWSLYCCDELTGFIAAVALVRPDPPSSASGETSEGQAVSKLHQVTLKSILKKWPKKEFARGVHREQIELCEEKLGIPRDTFVQIALTAMQGISEELGL